MRQLATIAVLGVLAGPAAADETIIIHDRIAEPPHVARPLPPVLPYSDAAVESNYWGRAWMIIDVGSDGFVTRLKFLNRPGHDLDRIAVDTAFATRFTPALDWAGKPTHARLIWALEWPAWWWSHEHMGTGTPPCRGSGPLNLGGMTASSVYRDCSEPDLAKAATERWIYSHVR